MKDSLVRPDVDGVNASAEELFDAIVLIAKYEGDDEEADSPSWVAEGSYNGARYYIEQALALLNRIDPSIYYSTDYAFAYDELTKAEECIARGWKNLGAGVTPQVIEVYQNHIADMQKRILRSYKLAEDTPFYFFDGQSPAEMAHQQAWAHWNCISFRNNDAARDLWMCHKFLAKANKLLLEEELND